jgi:hypothetical protein
MITFSSALAADITSLGVSKQAYSNTIISYLNANRRIIAKRNGTVFYDAELTGNFQTSGGNIIGIGNVGSVATQTAADLSTGTCTVEVSSGSHFMRGTFGLSKEAQIARAIKAGKTLEQATAAVITYDFTISDNPTTLTGLAIMNTLNIQAPIFLPSGTGPVAPELDADAPAFYQMFSYPTTNAEADRVAMGVKAINVRDPDMVFDRPYIAKQVGDVRVMRSAEGDGTVFGTGGECFKFAPLLLVTNKSTNADNANKPVYRMRFVAKPHNRWASFPYRPDFNYDTDTLSPTAFKIEIYRADMSLIDVIEMYSTRVNNVPGSGKPVNGHDQYCPDGRTTVDENYPVQPFWTCQMSLSWQSANYKPSTYLNHLHPGVEDQALDPTNVTQYDAGPDQWPIVSGNYLSNGLLAWRVSPKWSRKSGAGYDTTVVDNYFVGGWRDNYRTQMIGYGYEPGSVSQHVWYMSPGGSRHDRGAWPHVTVAWLSNQNSVRIHGAVPMAEMQHQWQLGYHNEGCHYVTNPELGRTLGKDHVVYGLDCYNDTYYNGGNEQFRPPENAVRLLTQANAVHNRTMLDYRGRPFVYEYQRDDQHNISNASQMTYFNNDPMGAFEGRDSFNSNILCAFGMTQDFGTGSYLCRQHAWYFKQIVETWAVGNNHPNGLSSAELEIMATRHLNQVYDKVYPFMNSNDVEGQALRDLGAQCTAYYSDDHTGGSMQPYDSKEFYFANVMMFAKQCGFLDRMREINVKNGLAIDMMMKSLCQASIDYFMDGNGRFNKSTPYMSFTTATPPAKWSWAQTPENGQLDWLHNPDGSVNWDYPEGYNTEHNRAQFLWVLKYFFPEITFPRHQEAMTKVRGWYDEVEAHQKANNGQQNWHWRYAMMGIPKPPVKVGPPTV